MISNDELRCLRNDVPMTVVIARLGIEQSNRGERSTFRCPRCATFHTAVNARTNLARCFRCAENFNPIDLVIAVRGVDFRDAVHELREIAHNTTAARLRTAAT